MKTILIIIVCLFVVVSMMGGSFMAGYYIGLSDGCKDSAIATKVEKIKFQKLLLKHGLIDHISLVEIKRGKMYYYRDGQCIELK